MRGNTRRTGRRGASLVLFVLSLMTILAFCGLTIDVGHWYHVKARLQTACDAAALGGCVKLPDAAEATDSARDYAHMNHVTDTEILALNPLPAGSSNPNQFEVILERVAGPFFTGLLGFTTVKIRTRALAEASNVSTPGANGLAGTALSNALYVGKEFSSGSTPVEAFFGGNNFTVVGDAMFNGSVDVQGGGVKLQGTMRVGHSTKNPSRVTHGNFVTLSPAAATGSAATDIYTNAPKQPLPNIDRAKIEADAKAQGQFYRLNSGTLQRFDPSTNSFVNSSAPSGWSLTGGTLHQNAHGAAFTGSFFFDGNIQINGNGATGTGATIAASGDIKLTGNSGTYTSTVTTAFISFSTSSTAIHISGNSQTFTGAFLAPNGTIRMQGNSNTINGGVYALNDVTLNGGSNSIIYRAEQAAVVPLVGTTTFIRLVE